MGCSYTAILTRGGDSSNKTLTAHEVDLHDLAGLGPTTESGERKILSPLLAAGLPTPTWVTCLELCCDFSRSSGLPGHILGRRHRSW